MVDTNYIGTIVKILETPKEKFLNDKVSFVKVRAQLPQVRSSKVVSLMFWGNLARDVVSYYKPNDYVIIEGYISFRNKSKTRSVNKTQKKVEIAVLKIYPFLLTYDRSISKILN